MLSAPKARKHWQKLCFCKGGNKNIGKQNVFARAEAQNIGKTNVCARVEAENMAKQPMFLALLWFSEDRLKISSP